jgi:DNA-binding NtrC family response regulator
MARILVVDDESHIRRVLALFLREKGFTVTEVASGEAAIEAARENQFDVWLLDFKLPGKDGLETLRSLREADPAGTALFMTAFGSIRSAVDAIKAGAFDYLTKPFDNEEVLLAVERVLEVKRLTSEVNHLRSEFEMRYGFADIIGASKPMKEVFRIMSKVAGSDATVLILGESGTGKELVARAIHRRSPREKAAFVAVNCSAIPSTLVEAEFFGHERGAFTDAKEARPGRFELADGGTLFLDEVGDLPLEAQAKLLRVLQEREVTRLGARRPVPVNVRVLAATNKDLESDVDRGLFRQDLYWRLNVLSIRLPPLRERAEDLALLIDHLLDVLNRDMKLAVTEISGEARNVLLAHDWPGNVRELENTLRRAMILAEDGVLRASDLPPRLTGDVKRAASGSNRAPTLAEAVGRAVERLERGLIQATLAEQKGNRTATAEVLDINRKTLFNKMRAYGLMAESETGSDDDS